MMECGGSGMGWANNDPDMDLENTSLLELGDSGIPGTEQGNTYPGTGLENSPRNME